MNLQAKNVILVIVAALVAGWTAFTTNMHPTVAVLQVGGFVVSVLNMLVQSPLVSQGGTPVATGAAGAVEGAKLGPRFVKVPPKAGFASMRALGFVAVIGLLSVLGMSQANCTAAQLATIKSDVNVVLTDAQEVCANAAFDAVIVALGTISPAAETAVQTACGIDATLQPVVHGVAQVRLAAHKAATADAGK